MQIGNGKHALLFVCLLYISYTEPHTPYDPGNGKLALLSVLTNTKIIHIIHADIGYTCVTFCTFKTLHARNYTAYM